MQTNRTRPGRSAISLRRASLALLVLLAGCGAQQTLTAGATLGAAGQKAALAMKQAAVLSGEQLETARMARTFSEAYLPNPQGAALEADNARQFEEIEQKLAARAKFLDSLSASYGALGDLAAYDAAGKFNTAFAGLTKDTQGLLAALHAEPLPATPVGVVQQFAGIAVSLAQREQVVAASRAMQPLLQRAIDAMTADAVHYKRLLTIYVAHTNDAARSLYVGNALSVASVVERLGAPSGLKPVPDVDRVVNANPRLRRALHAVIDPRILDMQQGLVGEYDKSLAALVKLKALHASLEQGQPLDLEALIAIIDELQKTAKLVVPAKGA